jgi:tetratricopeptide (TPR) repeat protein
VIGALVSGQARLAVFLEGSQAWCIEPQTPSPQPVSQGLLPYLFGDVACASYHPEATLAATGDLLERACREERGLQLALISMDPASSETTCELAGDALEELLEYSHVSEFIANRLFSRCLPEGTLWRVIGDLSSSASNVKLELFKRSVVGAQEAIGKVRAVWDALPADLFADAEDRAAFDAVLEATGAFRVLAMAVADAANWKKRGEVQVRLLSDKRYQAFANSRKVLLEMTRAIPSASQVTRQLVRGEHEAEERERRPDKPTMFIGYEAFQNVNRQKEAILDQLARRNFQNVERFVEDLVRSQLLRAESDWLAESLCDLAASAKQLGFTAFQLEWCRRAKEIYPSDPWVHTQFADALLSQGRLPEALVAYEAAGRDFPEYVVARNGKAGVLNAMGRLPEALEAYEATVRDFPDDAVARTGKAHVLKAMGRMLEALDAFETTSRDFPENAYPRTGTAEVLRAMGRLPEALDAYEATVRDFPENYIARNGNAGVLKAMGRLAEALDAYEATIRDFPEDAFARTGKAEVLSAMGRLTEALEAYDATVIDFSENAAARSGRAEVLKAMGRLPEALEAYEAVTRDFPDNAAARNGKATLLVLLGRYEEATALVRTDRTQTRDEWIGLHVHANIKLKQNSLDEADKLLAAGTRCPWADVRSRFIGARAVLRMKRRQLKEADSMIRSEHSLESKVIQIDVYRRMNKVGEAKAMLRELRGCSYAKIVEISRDLERNMRPGKRTVSDDEFLNRELELLMVAA